MSNFYNENEGYKKLREDLKGCDKSEELALVVGDAIQYGISVMSENLRIK